MAPWRGAAATSTLDDPEYATLLRDLAASGAYTSPSETLTLAARDYYWIVASCHDGIFHLTGWLYPSDAFNHISFGTWLIALDRTGVPFNPPRPWNEQVDIRSVSTGLPFGATGTATRGIHGPSGWAFGIAQDRLIGGIEF